MLMLYSVLQTALNLNTMLDCCLNWTKLDPFKRILEKIIKKCSLLVLQLYRIFYNSWKTLEKLSWVSGVCNDDQNVCPDLRLTGTGWRSSKSTMSWQNQYKPMAWGSLLSTRALCSDLILCALESYYHKRRSFLLSSSMSYSLCWNLQVMETAHRVGLCTTSTIMFGHLDRPHHW